MPEGGHNICHHLPQWRGRDIVRSKGNLVKIYNISTSLTASIVFYYNSLANIYGREGIWQGSGGHTGVFGEDGSGDIL